MHEKTTTSFVRQLLTFILLAATCAVSVWAPTRAAENAAAPDALQKLFGDYWSTTLREDPFTATQSGVADHNDRLPSVTPDDYSRQLEQNRQFQRRLASLDRNALDREQRLNYDLLAFVLHHRIALAPFRAYRIPLLSDDGFHVEVARMAEGVPMRTVRDYEDYLARLRAVPAYFEQNMANMRQGIKDGFTLPAAILPGIIGVIESQQVRTEDSAFYRVFLQLPAGIAAPDQERLRAEARQVIGSGVMPAYRSFHCFMVETYAPAARTSVGASSLPDGEAYYATLVKFYTNLDVTPQEVHEIGRKEVARIKLEMQDVIRQTGFQGDFPAFLDFLRTDPRFYAKTPEELLKEASYIAKQIDGLLPAYFGKLPRLPYTVRPVPADVAPNFTGGRYVAPPIGGTRAGEYWVNTYALEKRPLYVLTALSLHEAVPGHHLQGALGQELEGVPSFRRNLYPHAFGEGWGLYSERLGVEMGLYKTPYDHFGRLSYEMWRACRLVIDTGIHAFGWRREQAQDFLAKNAALSLHEVRTEIDRYIAWPGQALAYKMGEIKIRELRERVERELRDRFDIRKFHDAVLVNGGVPLPVLERQIDEYIAEARKVKTSDEALF